MGTTTNSFHSNPQNKQDATTLTAKAVELAFADGLTSARRRQEATDAAVLRGRAGRGRIKR